MFDVKNSSKPKITITDVAKHAGVAVTTVSRVINDSDEVKEETRKKVLQSMRELNYVPKVAARLLGRGGTMQEAVKTSFTVGLMVGYESIKNDPYFVHILNGVESELSTNGVNCIFSQIRSDLLVRGASYNEHNLSKLLMEDKLDCIIGVIIEDNETVELFKNTGLPLVFIDTRNYEEDLDLIKADNIQGAKKAVSYLISLGHRKIAYIRGETGNWFFNELEEGYRQAFIENGLPYEPQLVLTGGNSADSGYAFAVKLLENPEPPTAIFTNDITAIGVIKAVREKGLKVPEDISVLGYDDIDAASYIDPRLTTVQIPKYELGVLAAKRAIEHLNSEEPLIPMKTLLKTKLIIRESTGDCK